MFGLPDSMGPLGPREADGKYYHGSQDGGRGLNGNHWFRVVKEPFADGTTGNCYAVRSWNPREDTALEATAFCGNCERREVGRGEVYYECLGHDLVGAELATSGLVGAARGANVDDDEDEFGDLPGAGGSGSSGAGPADGGVRAVPVSAQATEQARPQLLLSWMALTIGRFIQHGAHLLESTSSGARTCSTQTGCQTG